MQPTSSNLALGLAALLAVAAAEPFEHKTDKSKDNPSSASFTSNNLGPAAFMWPPDRIWAASMDNIAPCGSSARPGNRTKYPLTGGTVALVAQDDYYNSKISISYKPDPSSNDDFTTLLNSREISDLNPGHECFQIPDAPANVAAGTDATLQIIYVADWDTKKINQTFYACADITYVPAAEAEKNNMCFKAVEPGEDDREAAARKQVEDAEKAGVAGHSGSSGSSGSSDSSESSDNSDSSSGQKIAGGKVAGIVAGSLAGVGAVGAGLLLFYRRRQQQKRSLRLARMEENARRDQFPMDKYTSSHSSA